MRASEAAKIFVGGGTMSLMWAFSLADKEDEEGIVDKVSGRLRFLSPRLSLSGTRQSPADPNPTPSDVQGLLHGVTLQVYSTHVYFLTLANMLGIQNHNMKSSLRIS